MSFSSTLRHTVAAQKPQDEDAGRQIRGTQILKPQRTPDLATSNSIVTSVKRSFGNEHKETDSGADQQCVDSDKLYCAVRDYSQDKYIFFDILPLQRQRSGFFFFLRNGVVSVVLLTSTLCECMENVGLIIVT